MLSGRVRYKPHTCSATCGALGGYRLNGSFECAKSQ